MMNRPLAPVSILFVLASLALPAPAGEVPVTWKGKKFTSSELPLDLAPAQREAVATFADWAKAHEYRMDFDAQGRLLLMLPKDSSRTKASLEIVGKTQSWFESALPAPDRTAAPKKPDAGPGKKPEPAPIPEDPESGGGAACLQDGPATGTPAVPHTAWGTGSIAPDSLTAVMIVLQNEKDYASLLAELARTQKYLKDWADVARKHLGFVIEEPLVGAYVENAAGQEEWSPDHELVNRVAQLMTLRRFGQQPNWVVQGIAWEAEMAFDGALFCFPFRSEFVFATEHTGWPVQVKLDLKDRGAKPLELAEVAAWKRNTWDAGAARLSWALVHQLLGLAPGKLSAALEELRHFRDEKDRHPTSPTSWERIAGFEVPADTQASILKTHFGKDVLEKAFAGMRSGKDPKSAKPAAGSKPDKNVDRPR